MTGDILFGSGLIEAETCLVTTYLNAMLLLRALAKVMDFMRGLSILFVVIHIYYYCYGQMVTWGINVGVIDKILLNFDRTAGLFRHILWTKLFTVLFLALSCLGTIGVKEENAGLRR